MSQGCKDLTRPTPTIYMTGFTPTVYMTGLELTIERSYQAHSHNHILR